MEIRRISLLSILVHLIINHLFKLKVSVNSTLFLFPSLDEEEKIIQKITLSI